MDRDELIEICIVLLSAVLGHTIGFILGYLLFRLMYY